MEKIIRRIFLCLFAFALTTCTIRDNYAYQTIAAWLDANALPAERVAVPAFAAKAFGERELVTLPLGVDAFALLDDLQASRPDYVVAWRGLAWDGARAQPWFQEHYRAVYESAGVYDGNTPLTLFRYTFSPFDDGERLPVERSFGTAVTEGNASLTLQAVRVNHPRVMPGEPLYVTLFWEGDFFALPDAERLVMQVVDVAQGQVRARMEEAMPDGVPADLLREGEDVLSHYRLVMPETMPAGDYRLDLALYRRSGQPVIPEHNLTLATLYRPPDVSLDPPTPDQVGQWYLGESIMLVGYDVPARSAPGETARVALYWHAREQVAEDYTVFVHLLTADGQAAAQADGKPLDWTYPTSLWKPGETIRDTHVLSLDSALPRGDYTIAVGLYDAATGLRLPLRDADGAALPDDRVLLSPLAVR